MSLEKAFYLRVINFLRKRNLMTKSKVSFIRRSFRRKDNFHNSFHNSLLLIFTYILQDTSLQKWNISLFLISFCLFIGSCYICQCIGLHLRPISHIFLSFILIHLSHFIKFYLLFTNLKFKEKILVFLFRRSTLLQFRKIVNSF